MLDLPRLSGNIPVLDRPEGRADLWEVPDATRTVRFENTEQLSGGESRNLKSDSQIERDRPLLP